MLIMANMNNGHLTVSASAAARRKAKARRTRAKVKSSVASPEVTLAAAGSLTRTKALLLAALRVWELKHRVHE